MAIVRLVVKARMGIVRLAAIHSAEAKRRAIALHMGDRHVEKHRAIAHRAETRPVMMRMAIARLMETQRGTMRRAIAHPEETRCETTHMAIAHHAETRHKTTRVAIARLKVMPTAIKESGEIAASHKATEIAPPCRDRLRALVLLLPS